MLPASQPSGAVRMALVFDRDPTVRRRLPGKIHATNGYLEKLKQL